MNSLYTILFRLYRFPKMVAELINSFYGRKKGKKLQTGRERKIHLSSTRSRLVFGMNLNHWPNEK